MKIFVVSQIFAPTPFRINDMVEQWSMMGHDVTVLTGLPDYGSKTIPKAFRWFRKRHESVCGADVYRVGTTARRSGVFWRALNYLSFWIKGVIWTFWHHPEADVIFSYQTSPVFQLYPAVRLAKKCKKPLIVYCLDLWPESLKAWGVGDQHLLYRWTKKRSINCYRAAQQLVVSSPGFLPYLNELGLDIARCSYIPQYAESIYFNIVPKTKPQGEVLRFLYAGNLGEIQDLRPFWSAFKGLGHRNFCIDVVGDGSLMAVQQQAVIDAGLEPYVTFHGRRSAEDVLAFYEAADILLLPLMSEGGIGATIPAKLQAYLAAGRPILGMAPPACQEIIQLSGSGLCVDCGDHAALEEKLTWLTEQRDALLDMGQAGRAYAQNHYQSDLVMAQWTDCLNNVTTGF